MAKTGKGYLIPQKAGAYAAGLQLLQEYREKLYDAYNTAFGEWDGFYTKEGTPSGREVEQIVLDRILEPVESYFKQRLAEEVVIGSPVAE